MPTAKLAPPLAAAPVSEFAAEVQAIRQAQNQTNQAMHATAQSFIRLARAMATPDPAAAPSAFDQLKDGLVVFDQTGRILRSSASAKAISPAFQEYSSVTKALNAPLSELTKARLEPTELRVLRSDNAVAYYDYTVNEVVEFGETLFYANLHDVTLQRTADKCERVRSKIYCALALESAKLLRATDLFSNTKAVVQRTVDAVIAASHADFGIVMVNDHVPSRMQVHAYSISDTAPVSLTMDAPLDLEHDYPGASAKLAAGEFAVVFRQNMPVDTQARLRNFGVHTVVFMPIYCDDFWWGQLMLLYRDEYADSWFYAECDALMTCASLVGTAVQRVEAQQTGDNTLLFQQALFDVVPMPLFARSLDGTYYYVNEAFEALTGHNRSDLMRLTAAQVLGPAYREKVTAPSELRTVPASIVHAGTQVRQDGMVIETTLRGGDGVPHGVLGVFQPNTQCGDACTVMRSGYSLLTSLLDKADSILVFKTVQGELSYANERFRRLIGCPDDADLKSLSHDGICQWLPDAFLSDLHTHEFMARSRMEPVAYVALLHDQRYQITVKPVAGASGALVGYLIQGIPNPTVDDTPFEELLASLHVPVITVTPRGDIVYANRDAADLLGVDEHTPTQLDRLVSSNHTAELTRFLTESSATTLRVTVLRRRDGKALPVELRATRQAGRVQLAIVDRSSAIDETHHLRSMLNAVPQPMLLVGQNGRVAFANRAAIAEFSLRSHETLTTLGFSDADIATITAIIPTGKPTDLTVQVTRAAPGNAPDLRWRSPVTITVNPNPNSTPPSAVLLFK